MTTAVCFKCGEYKFGALVPCEKCGAKPESEDEWVLSIAMSDHYHDADGLAEVAQAVKDGREIAMPPEARERLVEGLQELRKRLPKLADKAGLNPDKPDEDADR